MLGQRSEILRGFLVEYVIHNRDLWRRLVKQQARHLRRLSERGIRQGSFRFGDFQHPDMDAMFGVTGSPEFLAAREQWLADVRAEFHESLLERIVEAVD